MISTHKHRVLWFVCFSALHLLLYKSAQLMDALGGAVLFLSWAPWLPLAWAGVAVETHLFPMPTAIGLLWCATVWLAFYWLVAGALARQTDRSSKRLPEEPSGA